MVLEPVPGVYGIQTLGTLKRLNSLIRLTGANKLCILKVGGHLAATLIDGGYINIS